MLPRHIKYDQLLSFCTTTTLPTTKAIAQPATTEKPTTTVTQPTTTELQDTTTSTTTANVPESTITTTHILTTTTLKSPVHRAEKDSLALELPQSTSSVLNDTNFTTTMDDLDTTSDTFYERNTVNISLNSNFTIMPTTEFSINTTRENVTKATKQPDTNNDGK